MQANGDMQYSQGQSPAHQRANACALRETNTHLEDNAPIGAFFADALPYQWHHLFEPLADAPGSAVRAGSENTSEVSGWASETSTRQGENEIGG
jgi:hypothetical protein